MSWNPARSRTWWHKTPAPGGGSRKNQKAPPVRARRFGALRRLLYLPGDALSVIRLSFRLRSTEKSKIDEGLPIERDFMWPKTVVISLPNRPDRRSHIRRHFQSLGIRYQFSSAEFHSNGALGCARSHIRVLEDWDRTEASLLLVCEDDVQFLAPRDELLRTIRAFANDSRFGVLCIAANTRRKGVMANSVLSVSDDAQTTACYAVKASTRDQLIDSFKSSAKNLERGRHPRRWAIDMHWKNLQRSKILFALPNEKLARQIDSFSDIQGMRVSYGT